MQVMHVVVQHSNLSRADVVVLSLSAAVMLPILATWIVQGYRACSTAVKWLLGAFLIAAATAGGFAAATHFYVICANYPWLFECWF